MAKSFKQSLYGMVFRPLTILVALLWTHSFVNVPLKMGHAALDTVLQMLSTRSEYSGTVTFLYLDHILLLVQIQIALVGFLFLCLFF